MEVSIFRSLLCLLVVINFGIMNTLFSLWRTIPRLEMQNLEPILIFITVAEMGSFTHAAESLGIQKGRASMAVRKLEEDVGVRLLHRTTRSVQLTEDGRAISRARARDLLAEVDDLHSMFAGDSCGASWRVYGSNLPTEVARMTIVPALPEFMAASPRVGTGGVEHGIGASIWFKRGLTCVLRLGPVADETLVARPAGPVAHRRTPPVPAYLARSWRASIAGRSPASATSGRFIFRRCWAQGPMDGNIRRGDGYATLQLPGGTPRQQRADLRSRRPRRPRPDPGAGLGDWPIFSRAERWWRSWPRSSSPGAPRVARRRPSEQFCQRRVRAFMKWIEAVLTPYLE